LATDFNVIFGFNINLKSVVFFKRVVGLNVHFALCYNGLKKQL
jgi:hypothetical protein